MATVEAPIHPKIKEALVAGTENSTTLVMRSVRNTERVYKNSAAKEVQKIEAEKPGDFMAFRHIVKGENYRKSFQETGDTESSVWSCGQSMGLIDSIPTCKELIDSIIAEAEDVLRNQIPAMLTPKALDGRSSL